MTPGNEIVVVIPTLDEEMHVARAAQSALHLGHVLVVDSGSTDATRQIASDLGCEVVEHPWEGYAAQKNWALEHVADRFRWVLFLDADEWISDALAQEVRSALTSAMSGFQIPRRNIFEGRMLRHAWWYPDYQLRLFRTDRGRFEDRLVHEHVVVDGETGFLRSPLMHENLKGIEAFVRRHTRYADLEAQEMLRARDATSRTAASGRPFGSWPERRRWLKLTVWYRMPFRPAIRFLWMFVVKRGFLDGKQGLVYCQLLAAYEAIIDARLLELEQSRASTSRPIRRVTTSTPLPEFACPACRMTLTVEGDGYVCPACAWVFTVVDGIPILVLDPANSHGEPNHHRHDGAGYAGHGHKDAQSRFTDDATGADFEIGRPHGTPRLYRFLLGEKLRRATAPIGDRLRGATALVVCGGSGLEGEFLARAGAHVVSSDLSLGAARRTRERARRYGIDLIPVVADVEALPFLDRAFDLVLVHDGLHHLERPHVGLVEMARVADRWVSVTEPARANATAVAVRLGLALDREPAGNRVERMSLAETVATLAGLGFDELAAGRYVMYYRHEPGWVMSVLSWSILYPLVRSAWRFANALAGGVGNKMTVVSERKIGHR
jgi:glycosyltransferase involved in cell wall biosynthesis/SAM-dependent methyltransferase/uncharacterized protein YbaR (Trm112 family)